MRTNDDDHLIRFLVTKHRVAMLKDASSSVSDAFSYFSASIKSLNSTNYRIILFGLNLDLHTLGHLLNIVFHLYILRFDGVNLSKSLLIGH